jgi:hypothetical protein
MDLLIPRYGGDHAIRRYVVGDILGRLSANPGRWYIIDSRSGRQDYATSGHRPLWLYLLASPEVAAARKGHGFTPDQAIERDLADRNLIEGPLTDPTEYDKIIATDGLTKQGVLKCAIAYLREAGIEC